MKNLAYGMQRYKVFARLLERRFVLLLFLAAAGAISVHPQAENGVETPVVELIHQGDRIEIDVIGSLEFDWRGTVGPDGYLEDYHTIAEPVFARCLSTKDLAGKIEAGLSKILRNPQVEVRIIDRSGRPPALIDGAIKQPQRLLLKRRARLREIIVLAGGITDKASGKIIIFRPPGLGCGDAINSPKTLTIEIAEIIAGKQDADPEILPGDIVTIESAMPVYVIGGVAAPGSVLYRPGITLSRAIASAGGLTRKANDSDITIYRRFEGRQEAIEADLGAILDKKQPDVELKPYDIVEISEKGRPRKRIPPEGFQPRENPVSSLPLRVIDD